METIDAKALVVGAKNRYRENEQTREALDMAIDALLKQVPQNVILETVDESGDEYEFDHYCCPNCKVIIHQQY